MKAVGTCERRVDVLALIPPLATALLAAAIPLLSLSLSLSLSSWAMATAARKGRMNLEKCMMSWNGRCTAI